MNNTTPTSATSEYPVDEYLDRADRACAEMKKRNIDAIVVTGDWSISCHYRYLSGHWPRDFHMSWSRPHVMVLTSDRNAGLLVHYATVENAAEASWVEDVRSSEQPFNPQLLLNLLKDLGLENATIGWETGVDQRIAMPVNDYLWIRDSMPGANFVDNAAVMKALRMIKSPREVETMRQAAMNNHAAQEYAYGRVRPGSSELDIYKDIMTGLVQNGFHRPPVAQINSNTTAKFRAGLGRRARVLGPSPEPLQPGDLISVDCGGNLKGLWVEFDRMASIGKPTQRQEDLHKAARDIVQGPIHDTLGPGVSFREIIERLVEGYKSAGRPESDYREYLNSPYNHYCHGLGVNASEYPLVRYDSDDVLVPGMVIAVEGGIIEPEMRYHTEETVHITETGVEILTNVDQGYYWN